MPCSYLIDVKRRIVFSRGWGVLTDQEIFAHVKALGADARFDPGFQQIIDFRPLTEIRVTGAGVRGVARENPYRRDARRAMVVSTDEGYGLIRMYEMFAEVEQDQLRIFRDIGPALEWIGLDAGAPWPEQAPDATFDRS